MIHIFKYDDSYEVVFFIIPKLDEEGALILQGAKKSPLGNELETVYNTVRIDARKDTTEEELLEHLKKVNKSKWVESIEFDIPPMLAGNLEVVDTYLGTLCFNLTGKFDNEHRVSYTKKRLIKGNQE